MNTEEVTMLLTRIQVLDNRQVDQLTIEAWEPLMDGVDYEDAVSAVNTHFRTSEKYLLPAHVVDGAKEAKRRRISIARTTFHKPAWDTTPAGRKYCTICHEDEDVHGQAAKIAAGPNACSSLGHEYAESGYCIRCTKRDDRNEIIRPDGSKILVSPQDEWMLR